MLHRKTGRQIERLNINIFYKKIIDRHCSTPIVKQNNNVIVHFKQQD